MSDLDIDIEERLCAGDTVEEVMAKLDVPKSWVDAVWNRMMRDMDEWIANMPNVPRMTDEEMDKFIAEINGEL